MDRTPDERLLQDAQKLFAARRYGDAFKSYDQVIENIRMQLPDGDPDQSMSRDKIYDFFKRHNLATQSMNGKGLCAIHMADFALAGRMFEDAIRSTAENQIYSDPVFYRLVLQVAYAWPDDEIEKTVKALRTQDSTILKQAEQLFSSLPSELSTSHLRRIVTKKLQET